VVSAAGFSNTVPIPFVVDTLGLGVEIGQWFSNDPHTHDSAFRGEDFRSNRIGGSAGLGPYATFGLTTIGEQVEGSVTVMGSLSRQGAFDALCKTGP
jgi:hypothetical protein